MDSGLTPAQSEFNYLNTARTLDLYGVELHYARVSATVSQSVTHTTFVPVGCGKPAPRGLLKPINQICVNFSIRDKLSITTHNNLTHKNKNAFAVNVAVNALTLEVYSFYRQFRKH